MVTPLKREYRYLDSDADREAFIADMRRVRQDVIAFARSVPTDQWYTPRYSGWTLAAMLGHLQMMDTLTYWQVQLGAMGVALPLSEGMLHQFNGLMSRVFEKRQVETTLKGIEKSERKLCEYVKRLPMGRYSKLVYDPALSQYLTVEQAMQEFFLYHWREHLDTLCGKDDQPFIEPPMPNTV